MAAQAWVLLFHFASLSLLPVPLVLPFTLLFIPVPRVPWAAHKELGMSLAAAIIITLF